MLADVEEEQEQDATSFDDITGKELPWHAVRKARELELKYLRDLGVYEKAEDRLGADAGKIGMMKKSTLRIGDFNWDSARRICSTTKRTECRV